MSKSTFWIRLGRLLKVGSASAIADSQPVASAVGIVEPPAERRGWWGRFLHAERSKAEAHSAVAEGRTASQTHRLLGADRETRCYDDVCRAVDRLSGSVEAVPHVTKQQSEVLRTLVNRMEIQSGSLRKLEETLAQVPRLADAHRETLVTVSRKLDSVRESTDRGATVMNSLQRTIDHMSDTTSRSHEAVRELHAVMSAREARTAELLIDHSRRMTLMGAAGLILAGTAALSGVVSLLIR